VLTLVVTISAAAFFLRHGITEALTARCLVETYAFDDRMQDFPRVILWAWERPEDLRFINTDDIGVAFLAQTVYLRSDQTSIRPRLQPLSVAAGAKLIAVTRIESSHAALSSEQRARTVAAIAKLTRNERVAAIQIDFDARTSERAFYRDLLVDLRQAMPATVRLSITALASWCLGDNWLAGLPIDEAVPMLFRMGVDQRNIEMRLDAGTDFNAPIARHSLGISTDEPLARLPAGRRVYIFNPRSWSAESARKIIEEVRQWQ
jgi:hypothetical protein